MLKGVAVLCAVVSLSACTSFGFGGGTGPSAVAVSTPSEKIDANHWVTPPRSNELVFVGVSGRQSGGTEAEIQIAREDAARKVAMYYGVRAEVESGQYIGAGFLDVAVDTRTRVEYDQQIERYIEKLVFDPERDVFSQGNVIYVRFTYPETFPGSISYSSEKNQNGNPKWTTTPPHEINGFRAGVGFVRRQERLRDTILKSYESAAATLVTSASASISTVEASTFNSGSSAIYHHSVGQLTHFLVLETWIEPGTGSVWTLAVARVTN